MMLLNAVLSWIEIIALAEDKLWLKKTARAGYLKHCLHSQAVQLVQQTNWGE